MTDVFLEFLTARGCLAQGFGGGSALDTELEDAEWNLGRSLLLSEPQVADCEMGMKPPFPAVQSKCDPACKSA